MSQESNPLPKVPSFYYLCKIYSVDGDTLQALSDRSGAASTVVEAMFLGTPVARADAEKVLTAFSQIMGRIWNLSNTKIALTEGAQ